MSNTGRSESRTSVVLHEPTEEELELNRITVELAQHQLAAVERQSELAEYIYANAPDYIESTATADALSRDYLQEEIEALRSGSATPEQERLIRETIQAQLNIGEADIARWRQEGLENVRDVLAPSRGLRPGDSPILGLGSDIVEASIHQQGQLVSGLRGLESERLLNLPFERNLPATQLQAMLGQEAFNNRLQLMGTAGSLALGTNPNVNVPGALSVIQQPRLTEKDIFGVNQLPLAQTQLMWAQGFNQVSQGIESQANAASSIASMAAMCWVAAEYYGWYTPEWFAARRWIVEGWRGPLGDIFRRLYRRHGRRVAGWVRHNRLVRAALRPIFAWTLKRGRAMNV